MGSNTSHENASRAVCGHTLSQRRTMPDVTFLCPCFKFPFVDLKSKSVRCCRDGRVTFTSVWSQNTVAAHFLPDKASLSFFGLLQE
ncbi:hypothetical protein NPIL_25051 [Nephila pilipes]|uniref:Uncharacterized protein n=1 Tax=Nephila pilipes TaxID=299642 RepID=A0A8X6NX31_NEPPI|nr:hypothetical protein NPIL_25051 [Nephila pilipes]